MIAFATLVAAGVVLTYSMRSTKPRATETSISDSKTVGSGTVKELSSDNPLFGKKFYIDSSRRVTKLREKYVAEGNDKDAALIGKISSQPGTTWLIGPSDSDPAAERDIAEVIRTSTEAAAQGTVPVYQLYAITNRDACASYSKGGFKTSAEYLTWLEKIIMSLRTEAVFSVEADAVAQNIQGNCLSAAQIEQRYQLMANTMARLKAGPHVLAAYLDAGHAEWFPNPSTLVEPLRKAGISNARGVVVNVSNFVATPEITAWSKRLVQLIGDDKGVMIDTSRNGNGVPPVSITGDGRWCNPVGRAIGPVPTTQTSDKNIDAYYWGKIIGESDGSCAGNPAAGVFVPSLALDLARNSERLTN